MDKSRHLGFQLREDFQIVIGPLAGQTMWKASISLHMFLSQLVQKLINDKADCGHFGFYALRYTT